jgi:pimeloyl-ACP methyl ester carboxylesterase
MLRFIIGAIMVLSLAPAVQAKILPFPSDFWTRDIATKGKLTMPVLAIGGDKSFGATMAVVMRAAATDVTELVIPHSGHWLMEEQPAATIAAIRSFLDRKI